MLPAPPGAVCAAIFGAGSIGANTSQAASSSSSSSDSQGLLPCFLVEELGCTGLAANPWLPSTTCDRDARRQRRLRYATPLSLRQRLLLPLGPAAVQNEEEQQAAASSDGSGSIKVSCRVSSAGVPFADCFASYLLWQLAPAPAGTGGGGSSSTRLVLTASCTFHKPVLGPLRGQIEGESIQASREDRPGDAVAAACASIIRGANERCRLLADGTTQDPFSLFLPDCSTGHAERLFSILPGAAAAL